MCVNSLKISTNFLCLKLPFRALLLFVLYGLVTSVSVAQVAQSNDFPASESVDTVLAVTSPSRELNSQAEVSPPTTNTSSLAATSRTFAPKSTPSIGSGRHLMNVTLGLAAIVALIFSLSWLVKRFSQGAFSGNQHLKIIASLPLGTRERLLLIDAAGESILLGVTATSITNLHHFQTPVSAMQRSELGEHKNSDFSQKLMELMRQKPSAADKTANDSNAAT